MSVWFYYLLQGQGHIIFLKVLVKKVKVIFIMWFITDFKAKLYTVS